MHFRISYTMNDEDIFRSSIGCEIMLMIKVRLIFSRYNIVKVRMQFNFYEMCPSALQYRDVLWLHRYSQNEA